MSLVGIVRSDDLRPICLRRSINRSLELIEFIFNKDIESVVIKPNLYYYCDHSTGMTTNPAFVSAFIDIIRDHISSKSRISIVESDATAMKCEHVFRFLGYEKMAKDKDVSLVNLSRDKVKEISLGVHPYQKYYIPYTISQADILINIPTIKYHSLTGISCALKNVYGCNAYPYKALYHKQLDESIVNLNKLMKFDLCVVDGTYVSGIGTRKLGLIIASRDPVSIDWIVSIIANVDPRRLRHITLAHEEGVGNTHYDVRGDDPLYFKRLFPKRNNVNETTGYVKSKILRHAYNIFSLLRSS